MAWATPADVALFTGATVTTDKVAQAQTVIELVVGRTEADVDAEADLRRLKLAVAYQSAWIIAHPEIWSEIDVAAVSVEGHGQTNREYASAIYLAPLAHRAVGQLSWTGSRSIQEGLVQTLEDTDEERLWYLMGGWGSVYDRTVL